ncbi:MAG: type II secretion system F family protein [Acidimicrobiales bacterium]
MTVSASGSLGLALALVGGCAGFGLLLVVIGRRPASGRGAGGRQAGLGRAGSETRDRDPRRRLVLLAAGLTGLVALVVTRWPMSFPLGVLAVVGSQGLGRNNSKRAIERLEAIAAWTEMLRDTLAGASGLTQALVASAPISPRPVRQQMVALAARLDAGIDMRSALVELAGELASPAADNVVACLVMASSERAQRLSDLLGALADATREEVAMRLQIEASRASARTAVKMITGFSFALLALMAVFSRSYLSPYDSAGGQLALGVVGCIYGLGLWLMSAMARPKAAPRLAIAREPAS